MFSFEGYDEPPYSLSLLLQPFLVMSGVGSTHFERIDLDMDGSHELLLSDWSNQLTVFSPRHCVGLYVCELSLQGHTRRHARKEVGAVNPSRVRHTRSCAHDDALFAAAPRLSPWHACYAYMHTGALPRVSAETTSSGGRSALASLASIIGHARHAVRVTTESPASPAPGSSRRVHPAAPRAFALTAAIAPRRF